MIKWYLMELQTIKINIFLSWDFYIEVGRMVSTEHHIVANMIAGLL